MPGTVLAGLAYNEVRQMHFLLQVSVVVQVGVQKIKHYHINP